MTLHSSSVHSYFYFSLLTLATTRNSRLGSCVLIYFVVHIVAFPSHTLCSCFFPVRGFAFLSLNLCHNRLLSYISGIFQSFCPVLLSHAFCHVQDPLLSPPYILERFCRTLSVTLRLRFLLSSLHFRGSCCMLSAFRPHAGSPSTIRWCSRIRSEAAGAAVHGSDVDHLARDGRAGDGCMAQPITGAATACFDTG